jgi:hypothetical protein
MAFTPKTLFKLAGAKPGLWIYQSSVDAAAVVAGSAYFNAATDSLKQSDVIIVVSGPPASAVVDVMVVTSVDGVTPVTLSSTEGVTATLAADGQDGGSKQAALGQKLLSEAASRAAAQDRQAANVDDPIEEQLEAEREQRKLIDEAADKALELTRSGVSTQDGEPIKDEVFADNADTKPSKREKKDKDD